MTLIVTRETYEPHPAGEFRAQISNWEEDTHEKFGTQAKIAFDTEVMDERGAARRIHAWFTPKISPKSKLRKLMLAVGIDPDAMTDAELEAWSLDDLIGKRLRLLITHEPSKDDPKKMRDNIAGFMPYKKQAAAPRFDDDEETPALAPARSNGHAAATPAPAPQPAPAATPAAAATATAQPSPFDEDDD